MESWHIDIFDKCPDLRNLMILCARLIKKMKNINTLQLFIYFLSGENNICSSAKLGVGLCISSYKTKYLR